MNPDYAKALAAARFYRSIGLVPVPSRMDEKAPALPKCPRDIWIQKSVCTEEDWRTTNLQILTGVDTEGGIKVIVVDLDGQEAQEEWKALCASKGYKLKSTWICRTGGGGIHVYFVVPSGVLSCPSRKIWGLWNPTGGPRRTGGWVKHKEIRILGDNSLAVMPPSRHIDTQIEYQWIGNWSPKGCALPSEAPEWLLRMPSVEESMTKPSPKWTEGQPATIRFPGAGFAGGTSASDSKRQALLAAIPPEEKVRLAKAWGLRITAARLGEWVECRAIDRKDERPSANINTISGVYHDFGTNQTLSFFDLALELGAYPDFESCFRRLSEAYLK